MPSKQGDFVWACVNNWPDNYPNKTIPPDYTYLGESGMMWKGYCDKAVNLYFAILVTISSLLLLGY